MLSWEKTWNVVIAYFKVLYQHLPGGNSGKPVCRLRIKHGISNESYPLQCYVWCHFCTFCYMSDTSEQIQIHFPPQVIILHFGAQHVGQEKGQIIL